MIHDFKAKELKPTVSSRIIKQMACLSLKLHTDI